jgi:hypothetical protein
MMVYNGHKEEEIPRQGDLSSNALAPEMLTRQLKHQFGAKLRLP